LVEELCRREAPLLQLHAIEGDAGGMSHADEYTAPEDKCH
jgi:hypothetical protein